MRGVASVMVLAFLGSGCATILSGTEQELTAKPPGSRLAVYRRDGQLLAVSQNRTESKVVVPRPKNGQSYVVRVQGDGECPQYWLTGYKTTPTDVPNLLLGGIVGALIDASTGARGRSYRLSLSWMPTRHYDAVLDKGGVLSRTSAERLRDSADPS